MGPAVTNEEVIQEGQGDGEHTGLAQPGRISDPEDVSSLITGARSSVMRRAGGNNCSGDVGGFFFFLVINC